MSQSSTASARLILEALGLGGAQTSSAVDSAIGLSSMTRRLRLDDEIEGQFDADQAANTEVARRAGLFGEQLPPGVAGPPEAGLLDPATFAGASPDLQLAHLGEALETQSKAVNLTRAMKAIDEAIGKNLIDDTTAEALRLQARMSSTGMSAGAQTAMARGMLGQGGGAGGNLPLSPEFQSFLQGVEADESLAPELRFRARSNLELAGQGKVVASVLNPLLEALAGNDKHADSAFKIQQRQGLRRIEQIEDALNSARRERERLGPLAPAEQRAEIESRITELEGQLDKANEGLGAIENTRIDSLSRRNRAGAAPASPAESPTPAGTGQVTKLSEADPDYAPQWSSPAYGGQYRLPNGRVLFGVAIQYRAEALAKEHGITDAQQAFDMAIDELMSGGE